MDRGRQQREPIGHTVRLAYKFLFVEAEQRHLQDRCQLEHGTDRATRVATFNPSEQGSGYTRAFSEVCLRYTLLRPRNAKRVGHKLESIFSVSRLSNHPKLIASYTHHIK